MAEARVTRRQRAFFRHTANVIGRDATCEGFRISKSTYYRIVGEYSVRPEVANRIGPKIDALRAVIRMAEAIRDAVSRRRNTKESSDGS